MITNGMLAFNSDLPYPEVRYHQFYFFWHLSHIHALTLASRTILTYQALTYLFSLFCFSPYIFRLPQQTSHITTWSRHPSPFLSPFTKDHRYTREILEPAPFLSCHGAKIGGLWVFPIIKITIVRLVRMSPPSTAKDQRRICFACRVGKALETPIWALWLTMPMGSPLIHM